MSALNTLSYPLINSFIVKLQRISNVTGQLISWLSLLMVLTTFTIVVLRYGFNIGYIAMQESVMYLYAVSFLLGISYTYQADQHVRVDIFYNKMSPKQKAWVNLLGIFFLLLPMTGFIFYTSWGYVLSSWQLMEESGEAGGLAFVYLLKSNILIMAILLGIEAMAQILINMQLLFFNSSFSNANASNSKVASNTIVSNTIVSKIKVEENS